MFATAREGINKKEKKRTNSYEEKLFIVDIDLVRWSSRPKRNRRALAWD
jgi:hypothetical protein